MDRLDVLDRIGSEGVVAMRTGRQFTGIELKGEYFKMACENIEFERGMGQSQLNMFATWSR